MTDEERAEEYAKINCGTHPIQEDLRECAKYSYLAGLAEGKPKWHDLRKNPNDLPKDSESDECYLVAFKNFHNPEEIVTRTFYYNGREFVEEDYDEIPYFKKEGVLVGWCELPKFEG